MRLSSLKLSGFKSFADQTTLNFKASRSAIVGPNGCGKSNVIDAVRWVMGESSARQLRGGNMQDVIFTGTAKRKPVGMASVELRFENTQGKLGGAYNAYTELAVRRQVTREGKSEYFLNGTKCRRRDITDIFLGTGLGPRSYAIIEQGMINRLVDAKPEDMRIFIEEAAGVSRYQARRRETLQHLEHTQQNLERLEDIAHELKSQLKTLKKQSDSAVQYQEKQAQVQRLKVEILSFEYEQSTRLQQTYTRELTELGDEYKLVHSELTTRQHNLQNTQVLFQKLLEQSAPLRQQEQLAEKELAELSMRLEQQQHRLKRNTARLSELKQQQQYVQEQLQIAELKKETLQTQEEQIVEAVETLEQQLQQSQTVQLKNEYEIQKQAHQTAQQQLEQCERAVQQQQLQLEQLNQNIARLEQQHQAFTAQMQHVESLDLLKQELQDAQATVDLTQKILEEDHQKLKNLQTQSSQTQVDELKHQITLLEKERTHIQKISLKKSKTSEKQKLLDVLQLSEQAKPHTALIEKFLAQWLSAHLVDEFEPQIARQIKTSQSRVGIEGLTCLGEWIKSPQVSLWQNVGIANTLQDAQNYPLQTGQSILTLDGYHVGTDWVVGLDFEQHTQGELIHRVRLQEIEQLFKKLNPQLEQAEQNQQQWQEHVQQLQDIIQAEQQQHDTQKQHVQQLAIRVAEAQAFSVQKSQLEHISAQLMQDQRQKQQLDPAPLQAQLGKFKAQYEQASQQFDQIAESLEQAQKTDQNLNARLTEHEQQLQYNQQQIALLEKDITVLKETRHRLNTEAQNTHVNPTLVQELSEQHALKAEQVQRLHQNTQGWQTQLNDTQHQQQQLEQERQQLQQREQNLKTQLEEKRLAWQQAKINAEHYQEQLNALEAKAITGLKIDVQQHQIQLEQAQQQLKKLGVVNLTASKEYQEISQRYDNLKRQMQDLENTVDQLQKAMKTIDQETKKLFMDTFDQINHALGELFPKVFNGGEASLMLEGDWHSGVKLMARPPGKRNSSLALLSGGEKALTALALVFAIFKLNPAPFCVLDEVDAPLDDANVQRFCNLVKELSEQVQFIYITHNKLAMTMATDLLGVTMPEPGTSKLVTVNLEAEQI
ncbi:chromosome segregation SMC family protein [Acinetobacter sp. HY1485]|uniref:chromosome segregation SMC family protein n=1 Tax=Acinetobacter sp. HY1485 TaxID=2970918 RepID=UPI0022B971DD|nr:AAA family ATPase [Acinetobacter sp. HY1485]